MFLCLLTLTSFCLYPMGQNKPPTMGYKFRRISSVPWLCPVLQLNSDIILRKTDRLFGHRASRTRGLGMDPFSISLRILRLTSAGCT